MAGNAQSAIRNPQSTIEPPSTADRTAPSIEFAGVQVFVERAGDRVTGTVLFPHPVGGDLGEAERLRREGQRYTGRTECPVDYHSKRPQGKADSSQLSAVSKRVSEKLAAITAYNLLCGNDPTIHKGRAAAEVVAAAKHTGTKRISLRSLQSWVRRYELGGVEALLDRYVKPPKKVPTFRAIDAKLGLLICAWWAFRIGNCQTIDTKMMAAAVALIQRGYDVADLLATIDCYYSHDCNRERYPFKAFGRWARYDLDRWVHRAADQADYRRSVAEGRREHTALLDPITRAIDDVGQTVTVSTTRKRRARNRRTQADMAALSPQPSAVSDQPLANSQSVTPAAGSAPSAVNNGPETIAEALQSLDEQWRIMLLRAAGRDSSGVTSEARLQAITTFDLWWPKMPVSITGPIDMTIQDWAKRHDIDTGRDDQHTLGRTYALRKRRFLIFLPKLRDGRDTHTLHPARMVAP